MALLMCFLKSEKLNNLIKLGRELSIPFFCCQISEGVETKSCRLRFGDFPVYSLHANCMK